MYKIFLILAFFLLASPKLFAQNQENKLLIEEYLRQSESRKKTGITMMVIGAGTAGLGLILAAASNDWYSTAFGGGVIAFGLGSTATIISIPIIISSASSARKAAQLSIGANSVQVIKPNGPSANVYPALNFSIPLNPSKQ
ncbi:hypothetical protein [Algoriphagus sp. A40]|uniref:hypothetical protein n=1 Tax=Algoriphagus sp. A40 TaxID=1945863 RepID=UPI0009869410|nr:hypothetical protein [Algoriphagus sp. A40]OOG78632.1 hypothetical protein B0E43_00670 [Algoriphagus sp. A40]